MLGFIYIMSNPAHSGLLKIGQTSKDPLVRRKDLSSTGVPEAINIIREQLGDKIKYEEVFHVTAEELKIASKRKSLKITLRFTLFVVLLALLIVYFDGAM